MKKQPFNIDAAIAAAWKFCWEDNLKQRKKNEADFQKTGHQAYRADSTYYLTASDVENQVRLFAIEQMEGKAWGSTGRAFGRPMRSVTISGGKFLLGDVRSWLQHECTVGHIQCHNFDRGHISGARFRPAGEPISPTEQKTLAQKEHDRTRVKAVHLKEKLHGKLLCQPARRNVWGRHRRSEARYTYKLDEVTCPRCLKLMPAFLDVAEQRALAKVADHIDGMDRDDQGESPDY